MTRRQRWLVWHLRHGWTLYRILRPGYLTARGDARRWVICRPCVGNTTHPQRIDRTADALLRCGAIESDGCGHGYPVPWTSSYQLVTEA